MGDERRGRHVSRVDPDTNEESQRLKVGSSPTGIAVGDGVLWVADSVGGALLRVDPTTEEVVEVALAGLPSGVTFTPDGVWVSVAPNTVARIDPDEQSVVFSQPVGNGPTALLAAFGSIWVANHLDGTVTRLEPSTGRAEATIPVGQGPNALAAAGGLIWVGNELEDTVVAIEPATDNVDQTVPVGSAAASLSTDEEGLWLAVGASATEHRGGTLNVSAEVTAPESLDPARVYDLEGWRILTITNDGLLAYKKVGGPDGATLVPDLASALPDVSPDGLTYRFPLRGGIAYSTGEPIRPEDYRRAIERTLVLHPAGYLLSAIEGAGACLEEAPADCDLSQGIETDEEAVTFHLATPDADLPFKLALPFTFPVPSDTPAEDQGLEPLPATGPYIVTDAGPKRVEMERNTTFEEWSAAAQPDGFVDAISWRFDEELHGAFSRLQAGDLDVMVSEPGPQDLAVLRSTHPDQVLTWPAPFTLFVGFDTVKPPFDDERVRQAVSFALDRGHLVDLLGGSTTQRQTCQILPPELPGLRALLPLHPRARQPRLVGPGPRPSQGLDRGGRRGGNLRRRPDHRQRIASRFSGRHGVRQGRPGGDRPRAGTRDHARGYGVLRPDPTAGGRRARNVRRDARDTRMSSWAGGSRTISGRATSSSPSSPAVRSGSPTGTDGATKRSAGGWTKRARCR